MLNRYFSGVASEYKSIKYAVHGITASISLARPHRFNAISEEMPGELKSAVEAANWDSRVKAIVITGEGKAFCSGYDLKMYAESERGHPCNQKLPWDPYKDYQFMSYCNDCWMSLWKSLKPTIAKINGVCVGGGTDIALNCDVTFISDNATIGYPPARLWGCPTGAMWTYRIGCEKAKRMLLTGDVITGTEAEKIGLIGECVAHEQLDLRVNKFIEKIGTVPMNQLFFQKQVINNVIEQLGLFSSQRLATFVDGMTRHTPEGIMFQERCQKVGFKQAVVERDSGSFKFE